MIDLSSVLAMFVKQENIYYLMVEFSFLDGKTVLLIYKTFYLRDGRVKNVYASKVLDEYFTVNDILKFCYLYNKKKKVYLFMEKYFSFSQKELDFIIAKLNFCDFVKAIKNKCSDKNILVWYDNFIRPYIKYKLFSKLTSNPFLLTAKTNELTSDLKTVEPKIEYECIRVLKNGVVIIDAYGDEKLLPLSFLETLSLSSF